MRSPPHAVERFVDDRVGQRGQRLIGLGDENGPFAHELDVGWRRFDPDAAVTFAPAA